MSVEKLAGLNASPRLPGTATYTLLDQVQEDYLRNHPDCADLRRDLEVANYRTNEAVLAEVERRMKAQRLGPTATAPKPQPNPPSRYYPTGVQFHKNGSAMVNGHLFSAVDAAKMLLCLIEEAPFPCSMSDRPSRLVKRLRALTPAQKKSLLALLDAD
jgi:hypothetical protein